MAPMRMAVELAIEVASNWLSRGDHLTGIDRVLDDAVEAQQFGQPAAVQRPNRIRHHAGAHGAQIQAAIGLGDALLIALEQLDVRQQVVTIGDRHGLHAVGIGRHQNIEIVRRGCQQFCTQAQQGLGEIQRLVAQLGRAKRGVHILAAASGVNDRHLLPDLVGHDALDLQHVTGALAAGLPGLANGVVHPLGDQPPHIFRKDAFLHQHDGRGLVDLVDPVELVLGGIGRAGMGFRAAAGDLRPDAGRGLVAFLGGLAWQLPGIGGERGLGDQQAYTQGNAVEVLHAFLPDCHRGQWS